MISLDIIGSYLKNAYSQNMDIDDHYISTYLYIYMGRLVSEQTTLEGGGVEVTKKA